MAFLYGSCERYWAKMVVAWFVLAASLLAQDYSHLYTGTDVQLPDPSPFKAADPINTCYTDTGLSHAKLCRVTGPELIKTLCPVSFAATQGGGGDPVTNVDGTELIVTCNGVTFVLGYNPATLQVHIPTTPNKCIGNPTWSHLSPDVLYCHPQNSTIVNALSIPNVDQPATTTQMVDFSKCPRASTGPPMSGSILGVGEHDQVFTADMSWTGGQDTAHLIFAYNPSIGCSTLDTQGNGTSPIVYFPNGSAIPAINTLTWEPVMATWKVHESSSNGLWVKSTMAGNTCAGIDCGKGDGGIVWLVGSNTLEMMSEAPVSSGHGGLGLDLIYNMGNPNMIVRHITDMMDRSNAFVYPTCCQDHHFTLFHKSDLEPIFDVTGGPFIIGTPGAYYNEVVIWFNGKAYRPGHTYSCGCSNTSFEGEYGIGAPNQPRTVYFFTSDMEGALGSTPTEVNRADVFARGLIGQ